MEAIFKSRVKLKVYYHYHQLKTGGTFANTLTQFTCLKLYFRGILRVFWTTKSIHEQKAKQFPENMKLPRAVLITFPCWILCRFVSSMFSQTKKRTFFNTFIFSSQWKGVQNTCFVAISCQVFQEGPNKTKQNKFLLVIKKFPFLSRNQTTIFDCFLIHSKQINKILYFT